MVHHKINISNQENLCSWLTSVIDSQQAWVFQAAVNTDVGANWWGRPTVTCLVQIDAPLQ